MTNSVVAYRYLVGQSLVHCISTIENNKEVFVTQCRTNITSSFIEKPLAFRFLNNVYVIFWQTSVNKTHMPAHTHTCMHVCTHTHTFLHSFHLWNSSPKTLVNLNHKRGHLLIVDHMYEQTEENYWFLSLQDQIFPFSFFLYSGINFYLLCMFSYLFSSVSFILYTIFTFFIKIYITQSG